MFGSGTDSEPSEPWISMGGRLCAQTSKLVMMVPTAPPAKSMTPAMWVGVSTMMVWPDRGWLVIRRSGNDIWADPVTRFGAGRGARSGR